MNKTRRAVLLSGLILPGLGQWSLGRKKEALLFLAGVFLPLTVMIVRIFLFVYKTLLPSGPEELTSIHHQAWSQNWRLLIIILVWLGSIIHARHQGKKDELSPPREKTAS